MGIIATEKITATMKYPRASGTAVPSAPTAEENFRISGMQIAESRMLATELPTFLAAERFCLLWESFATTFTRLKYAVPTTVYSMPAPT